MPDSSWNIPKNILKNSIKILKIKKHHFGIISSQTGPRQAEKDRKKKYSKIFFLKKKVILASFMAKLGQDRSKKREKNSFQVRFLSNLY